MDGLSVTAKDEGFVGQIHQGSGWYCFSTPRFKTITLHAFIINELTADEAAFGALLPHVLQRGTQKWPTYMQMEQTLEDMYGASFRADVGKIGDKQLISFHLEIVNGRYLPGHPDTLSLGLDFLQEVLDHPLVHDHAFHEAIVQQEKDLLKRRIQGLINDKGQYAVTRLIEAMADGRRFGLRKLGRVEDLERITPHTLYEYYRKVHQTHPIILFAVGDIDPVRIEQFMQHYQHEHPRHELQRIDPYTPHYHDRTLVERQDIRQGKINMGYYTGITLDNARYPALMMYAGILGGFPHSKLFLNVRERASLAYYAYARLDAALGYMLIGAGIEFEDFDAAVKIIAQQLEAMKQGDISDQEWEFTLRAFDNDILSEEDNPSQIISRQLEHLLVGGGLMGEALKDALHQVTRDQVQEVAQHVRLDTVFFLTRDSDETATGTEATTP
ncbi:MAG: insulinase family protein [Sulfobacillus thermosulfidooxidans]|uniref:Insulinase family protein n=1 Tax=Sulfobacillus thermosulfidooxidans TaxID=28034 RepID=A0A2T2X0R9_SULTH|nr:MAG: insulinase family protein [Sulfobacillus thermosulfidooxidans]